MCLAVPGKIISIDRSIPEMTMAKVDFGGILKNICIEWVDVKQGDYILTHAGIAISVVDEKEAEETLKDLKELQKCVSYTNIDATRRYKLFWRPSAKR